MTHPALIALGHLRLDPPETIAPRDWILGVISVQIQGTTARLRAHRTGQAEPLVTELPPIVHVALAEAALPEITPPPLTGTAALSVFLDGILVATATLAEPDPDARAFGHVFCRWLRSGDHEAGFDLTDFQSLPEGTKYQRLVSRPLAPHQTVSYAFTGR